MTIPHENLLQYREQFPIVQKNTYLNTCSLAPLSTRVEQSQQWFMEQWRTLGGRIWFAQDGWWETLERVRQNWAALIGAYPHEVALTASVSSGLSSIASSLQFEEKNNVVMTPGEFPTLPDQWLVKPSVECRYTMSANTIGVPANAFEPLVDKRTAFIATSRVYYSSGYRQDVASLAELAHRKGTLLLIDDYQAGIFHWISTHRV